MPSASIAGAQLRVAQSRDELGLALRRLGASLARPSSLLAAAAAGAVVGFSLERLGGAGAVTRGLAAAALRHGAALYVRYRKEQARTGAENRADGLIPGPDAHPGPRPEGFWRGKGAR
jgi:phytoene dehydrogenase-like protein